MRSLPTAMGLCGQRPLNGPPVLEHPISECFWGDTRPVRPPLYRQGKSVVCEAYGCCAVTCLGSQSPLCAPSTEESPLQRVLVEAEFSSPLGDGLGLATPLDPAVAPLVVRLLGKRSPTAVVGRVVPVVVDTVDCGAFRRSPMSARKLVKSCHRSQTATPLPA